MSSMLVALFTQGSVMTNFALGIAAMLGVVQKDFYCKNCQFTWPRKGSRLPRKRRHGPPYYFIEGVEQTRFSRTAERRAA